MARPAARTPVGHVVHIERIEPHGVRVWLDGVLVKSLRRWSLVEEHRPPSSLTLVINTDAIVWGPPPAAAVEAPAFVDDGRPHWVQTSEGARQTPSGKRACETCGEAWMCSTATRRWELHGSTLPVPTAFS